ncbi:hypothetical protein Q7P35_010951 [Cladosporium inversicolor]
MKCGREALDVHWRLERHAGSCEGQLEGDFNARVEQRVACGAENASSSELSDNIIGPRTGMRHAWHQLHARYQSRAVGEWNICIKGKTWAGTAVHAANTLCWSSGGGSGARDGSGIGLRKMRGRSTEQQAEGQATPPAPVSASAYPLAIGHFTSLVVWMLHCLALTSTITPRCAHKDPADHLVFSRLSFYFLLATLPPPLTPTYLTYHLPLDLTTLASEASLA